MALYDLRKVVLPSVEVFPVGPRSKAPNRRKAAAIDPYRRITGRIRVREKCWNQRIERLRCSGRLSDVDAIRRVGELEIVHGACADDLAQPADGDAAGLAPRLLDLGSAGIGPPTGIANRGRPKGPSLIRVPRHQRQGFREAYVPTEAILAPIGRLAK